MVFPNAVALVMLLSAFGGTAPPQARVCAAQNVYPAWTVGTPYKPGDLVSYVGVQYICLQAHTAKAGQEPPAAPALWRVFSGMESEPAAVPKGLVAVPDGPNRIVVSWSMSQGASGYDLQVDGAVVEGVSNPYLHKDLAQGSSHTYRVRAVNDAGKSAWSEAATCATGRP